jgi:hypothetical protein
MMSVEEMGAVDPRGFERVIRSEKCQETVLVLDTWNSPRPVSRVWCLYEILLTTLAGKELTIGLPLSEEASLILALEANFSNVLLHIGAVDAEQAESTMAADKVAIFAAVQRLLPDGFAELHPGRNS